MLRVVAVHGKLMSGNDVPWVCKNVFIKNSTVFRRCCLFVLYCLKYYALFCGRSGCGQSTWKNLPRLESFLS